MPKSKAKIEAGLLIRLKRKSLLVILRLLLYLFIILITIEIFLQIAHIINVHQSSRLNISDSNAPIILSIGDSHTYGWSVNKEQSYPAQLEKKLHELEIRVNVLNMGVPGYNTSQIRRKLPEWLKKYKPVCIILLASINSGWNIRDTMWSDWEDGVSVPFSAKAAIFLQSHSRIVKGLSALLYYWQSEDLKKISYDRYGRKFMHKKDVEGAAYRSREKFQRAMRDFKAIIKHARKMGAIPILMTYTAPTIKHFYASNLLMREIAAETGTILVDNDIALRPFFTLPNGRTIEDKYNLLFQKDYHLTAFGYELITSNILSALKERNIMGQIADY